MTTCNYSSTCITRQLVLLVIYKVSCGKISKKKEKNKHHSTLFLKLLITLHYHVRIRHTFLKKTKLSSTIHEQKQTY